MSNPPPILIRSEVTTNGGPELLQLLEGSLPVKFATELDAHVACAGEIVVAAEAGTAQVPGDSHPARLTIASSQSSGADGAPVELKIRFANDAAVPFPFRGRSLISKAIDPGNGLTCAGNEKVLASGDQGPLWVVSVGSGPKRYRSAFALPAFPAERIFSEVFNGDRFIEFLPVLHFLREACGSNLLEGPPLRACFIFDDPNLHWPRYGFVNFQEIASRAITHNYHVTFATVPLDAWFTHAPTARLFRKNAARLSLCVHGNNHTREELAGNYSQTGRVSLLMQAIRRVEHLERRAGVQVCRIMVPPHGACVEEMLAELPGCGFEGACISAGSLRAYNKSNTWTRRLGLAPTEIIAGCPVMPRWAMTGGAKNAMLVAAYLQQPLILRGHHRDIKAGVEVLDEFAGFINSLGPVRWSTLSELSRMNYLSRMDEETLWLKPLGRKMTVTVPKGTTRLRVEDPFDPTLGRRNTLRISEQAVNAVSGEPMAMPANVNGEFSLELEGPAAPFVDGKAGLNPRALVRRLLTEGRDRFLS